MPPCPGHTLAWEKGRQLKSFDSNTYTYNANGVRTSKTVNGVQHTYTLEGSKILREVWGGNTLVPLYDNESSVCGIIYNDTPYYFFKNLQGDIISITDMDGDVIARYSYDAWGVCTITQDSSAVDIASINPFRYRGYYFDSDIGLYYLQSRYYNPVIGRFLNADEASFLGISGYNLFSYCKNTPVILSDPNGHCSLDAYPSEFLDMNALKSQSWLAKFISNYVSVLDERGYDIFSVSLGWAGVSFALSAIYGMTLNPSKFFTISDTSVSCNIGGISFSSGSNHFGMSISTSVFGVTLEAFVALTNAEIIYGFSLTAGVIKNNRKYHFGIRFAIRISYITLAIVTGALLGACVLVPALAPVISKITGTVIGLISNPLVLEGASVGIATLIRAVA